MYVFIYINTHTYNSPTSFYSLSSIYIYTYVWKMHEVYKSVNRRYPTRGQSLETYTLLTIYMYMYIHIIYLYIHIYIYTYILYKLIAWDISTQTPH